MSVSAVHRILTSIKQGSKKPVCYGLALETETGLVALKKLPVMWTKKVAEGVRRELRKATGLKFVVTEAWIKKSKTRL